MFGMDGIAKYNIISKTPESLPSSLNYNRTQTRWRTVLGVQLAHQQRF